MQLRNYDSEIYAFSKRINEQFNESLLRQAFVDPGFSISETDRLAKLGLKHEIIRIHFFSVS